MSGGLHLKSLLDKRRTYPKDTYKPEFFYLTSEEDKKKLNDLLTNYEKIEVIDTLHDQLRELVNERNPNRQFTQEEEKKHIKEIFDGKEEHEYGVWVYYPWLNKLVHTVDKEDFIFLRTSRNRFKITSEEQQVLRDKVVGVIGLSVGSAIAMAIAMERGCGRFVLADYDELELTNLNRVNSGLHNAGENKAVFTARKIAELDPFIEVELFTSGISETNAEEFFNTRPDILIEECDSLPVKLFARKHAKKNKIPVIMETNDRGMIDIERFDLEEDRELFHGLLGQDYEITDNKELQKNLVMKILDFDNISERGRLSLMQIGSSIRTWPQLASSVFLGAGVAAMTARKILLGKPVASGRYYVDIEEIIK